MKEEIAKTTVLSKKEDGESLIDKWLNDVMPDPKSLTRKNYKAALSLFEDYIERNNIESPTKQDIDAYKILLEVEHKPGTVQAYITAIKLFYKWAAKRGYCENIAEDVKGERLSREHKRDCLTVSQVKRVLNAIDRSTLQGLRDYAIILLMVTTGLREISVISANIEDIRNAGDSTVLYYVGKGYKEKTVPVKLAPQVEEAINCYIAARPGKHAPEEPLFVSIANRNNGERLTTASVSRTVKKYLRAVGIDSERITAHSLRHTAATVNLLNGGTLEETQQLLNHSSINTTMIYAHALTRAANNSEIRITEAIFA